MKRVISVPLEAGGAVQIEVEGEAAPTLTRGLHPGELAEGALTSFEAALDAIRPAALAVAGKFRDFADAPEQVEVQFGVKFAGQAGAFIASASTEAQFQIRVVWKGKAPT